MNATGATIVFSVPFAVVGLVGAYLEGIDIGLISLALTVPTGGFAFWFGARRVRHKWYSALISGVLALAVTLQTLPVLNPILSPWQMLLPIEVVIAAVSFWLGSRPPFPEIVNETRS